jgi:structural maintenance of chromosome 2
MQSIELIGFKSYATRTVVEDFDPKFNAITGLNGSGKSNILDAICFVLGITSLQHVRVTNLQELVYKQGQAGVTKASVTIVFDNRDANQKPVGYEECEEISVSRQIVIGGRNKYLINGHNAQASQVANMFRSVQLNVNNPHFMILQGRITKVLNMKPEEIRDMLQEVLGTLMYETEKQTAQKKLSQKDQKVKTIEDILTNQITPKVEKLKADRQAYLQYSAAIQEIQRLMRLLVAFEYYSCDVKKKSAREEAGKISELANVCKTEKKQAALDETRVTKQIEDWSKRRAGEASKPLEAAAEDEKKHAEELVRADAAKNNAREVSSC